MSYRANQAAINHMRRTPYNLPESRIHTEQWGDCTVMRSWLDVLDQEHLLLKADSDGSQHEVILKGIKIGEDWIR